MGFAHPGCGGQIVLSNENLRIAAKQSFSRYSEDGIRIGKEWVDGYSSPDQGEFDKLDIANARARNKPIPKAVLRAPRP